MAIDLLSSDGQLFTVPISTMRESGLIYTLLKDFEEIAKKKSLMRMPRKTLMKILR
jgi:hypothetical protein